MKYHWTDYLMPSPSEIRLTFPSLENVDHDDTCTHARTETHKHTHTHTHTHTTPKVRLNKFLDDALVSYF